MPLLLRNQTHHKTVIDWSTFDLNYLNTMNQAHMAISTTKKNLIKSDNIKKIKLHSRNPKGKNMKNLQIRSCCKMLGIKITTSTKWMVTLQRLQCLGKENHT